MTRGVAATRVDEGAEPSQCEFSFGSAQPTHFAASATTSKTLSRCVSALLPLALLAAFAQPAAAASCGFGCAAGYFYSNCTASCVQCSPGFYCRGNLSMPLPCPAMTYSNVAGAKNNKTCVTCPSGQRSTEGATSCSACPPLTFSDPEKGGCSTCPTGHISLGDSCTICAKGKYADNVTGSCLDCSAGYSCLSRSRDKEAECSAGTYSDTGDGHCKPCEPGFACPATAVSCTAEAARNKYACPPGTYASGNATTCTSCPAMHYCPNPRLAEVLPCPLGYYSPGGTTNCSICPPGFECNVTNGFPVMCAANEYADGQKCSPCPAGYSCANGEKTACAPGHYSPAGTLVCLVCSAGHACPDPAASPVPCTVGHYAPAGVHATCLKCNSTNQLAVYANATQADTCQVCPAGSYCPNSYEDPRPCPRGYVSGAGARACTPCSIAVTSLATYTEGPGATQCLACPAGYHCPFSTADPIACSVGSYSLGGVHNCTLCPAGSRCPLTNAAPVLCNAGSYATGGFTQCKTCPSNHMCATTTNAPVACDITQGFYAPAGSTNCLPCPPGASCAYNPVSGNITFETCSRGFYRTPGHTGCNPCPPGHYCPTTIDPPLHCPTGTYSLAGSVTCFMCPPGKQCYNGTFPMTCPQGFFSRQGDGYCTHCPAGYACVNPWSNPIICPTGTFSEGKATNCTACPRGWECPLTTAFMGVARPCEKGFYSTGYQTSCTPCPAGYECPSVFHSYARPCPPGWHSTTGQHNCTRCSAGWACPGANRDFHPPIPCPIGTYSLGGQLECTICPAGYACPVTTAAIVKTCPNGTFSAPGDGACTLCAAGYYCPTTAVQIQQPSFGELGIGRQVPCQPGQFAPPGSFSCMNCPNGFICTSTTALDGGRLQCPAGHFTARGIQFVSYGATNCAQCPGGSDCSTPGILPAPCSVGTYATVSGCQNCPAGYFCETPSSPPVPCPAGQYSVNGSTQCTNCEAGYLCDPKSTTPTPSHSECPLGSYCPAGTTVAVLCPAGTYGAATRGTSVSHVCTACHYGHFCPAGTAGTGGMLPCDEGTYCPTNAAFPTPCPSGTYSPVRKATSRSTCITCPEGYFCPSGCAQYAPNACPPGFYCPAGTGSGFENACPVGTYSADMKMTSASQCLQCPVGHTCPNTAMTAPTPCPTGEYQNEPGTTACRNCEAGWACPRTAMTTYLGSPCSVGHYCPKGTTLPTSTTCPGGTYTFRTNLQSSGECEICWRGYYCPSGTGNSPASPQPCGAGHYCPGVPQNSNGRYYYLSSYQGQSAATATQFPCPQGTYSAATDLYAPEQCDPCPPGSYCAGGGTTVTGACGAGYYCPVKSFTSTQQPCAPGTYNPSTGAASQGDCLDCRPGSYCPSGSSSMTACPQGSYSPFNRTTGPGPSTDSSSGLCLLCPAGYFCPQGSTTPQECPPGQYSESGSAGCTTCEAGRYCPQVATTADQKERLFLCPAGLLCMPGLSRIPATEYDACPVGHYCPLGTTTAIPCVPGTYNPTKGRASLTECLLCSPGFYCSVSGAANVTGECDPGHYCPSGSLSATQMPCPARYYRSKTRGESEDFCSVCPRGFSCPVGTGTPLPCPRGYYCIAGTELPQPCPIGTFGNATGLKSQDDCSACTAGYYCDGLGLPNPTGLCDPSYFCIGRAFTSAPPGLPTGGLCPKGGYCPPGSSFPTACAEGTFNNFTGGSTQQDCVACTPGHYCSGSNLPFPTGPCAAGFYCTGGASLPTQFRTPAGHFSLAGAPAPEECPLGTFNPSPAQGSCLPCVAGFYCPTRAMVNFLPCPPGGYCPAASVLPKACVIGTYQPETRRQNVSNCLLCPPGKYCGDTNASAPGGECLPGFYCKRGCVNPTCSQYVLNFGIANNFPANPGVENSIGGQCPYGRYCGNGTAIPTPCPPGTIRDTLQGTDIDSCTACPAGYYCDQTGMSQLLTGILQPQKCMAGYYCPGSNGTGQIGCTGPQCSNYGGQACDLNQFGCHGTTNIDLTSLGPRYCPTGFYCPTGSIAPVKCPRLSDGRTTFSASRGQTNCDLCPPGRICDPMNVPSLQVPVLCPKGKYCPPGSDLNPPLCPIGSWSDQTGLHNRTQCHRCPPGRYCPYAGRSTPFEADMPFCFGGYFCTYGAIDGTGRWGVLGGLGGPCPVGHYCPNGTTHNNSFPCPPGTFKPTIGGSSAGACQACLPGFYCAGRGNEVVSGPCERGYYCPRGCSDPQCTNKACTLGVLPGTSDGFVGGPCPSGHYCPLQSILPTMCPFGEYQTRPAAWTCDGCPPGHHCTIGASSPRECPRGHYCPPRTASHSIRKCPPGTVQNMPRATNVTDCLLCPAGHYCPYFAMNTSIGVCHPGYYCVAGAMGPQGTVGPRGGDGGGCPVGHYCPAGTTSNTSFPCPPGTYNPDKFSKNSTACSPCLPGFYCQGWGNSAVTGPCKAGYYCPTHCEDETCSNKPCRGNCAHPTPYDPVDKYAAGGICPSGHYCPQTGTGPALAGASAPIMCPAGYYAPDSGMKACIVCPGGRWCGERTQQPQPCPSGYYCPKGTPVPNKYPCPVGTIAVNHNNTNYTDCAHCPPGHYCGARAMNRTSGLCLAGYYCTSGAATPDAKVGPRGGIAGPCPPGHYCPMGTTSATQFPCPAGTYQGLELMTNKSSCIPCTPGFFCPTVALSAATLKCKAGYYCPRGCSDDTCSNMPCSGNCADPDGTPYNNGGVCPKGHICPGTAIRGQVLPQACPAGSFAPSIGMISCLPCPPGFYCAPATHTPLPCPIGKYCPTGTKPTMPDCPIGTFNDQTHGQNLTDCPHCKPGRYCARKGNSSYTGLCFPGYYCTSGAVNGRGLPGPMGGEGGPCIPGYYCPAGTQVQREFPCPAGTYQPKYYATNASACLPCLPGYYCGGIGMANVSGPCRAGFSCPGGCADDECSNRCKRNCTVGSGGPCPVGFACPQQTALAPVITASGVTMVEGNIVPKPCANGLYSNGPGAVTCVGCPAGFYCLPGSVFTRPLPCPPGSYCPPGTGVIQPKCPSGSYSPLAGLNSSLQCYLCPGGRYCPSSGMTAPASTPCAAGYYCTAGARDPYGRTGVLGGGDDTWPKDTGLRQVCPLGHYCPIGAIAPTRCPPGTYNPEVGGQNASIACRACDGGKYCEGTGLTTPTGPCVGGFYCPRGCSDKRCFSRQCDGLGGGECPVGYHCPNGTAVPLVCSEGTFAPRTRMVTCEACSAGFYCPSGSTEPRPCPVGHYCPRGTTGSAIPPCPRGTFSNHTMRHNASQCTLCPPGAVCSVSGLTAHDGWCRPGYFCAVGAVDDEGHTGTLGGSGGPCPVGHYCPSRTGAPIQCAAGTFNPIIRGMNASACRPCTAGEYCATQALSAPTFSCTAGYYCVAGSVDATPSSGQCPTGAYCPTGSPQPVLCGAGTYNPLNNRTSPSDCLPCTAGSYCLAGSSNPTGPCDSGYYCPGSNMQPNPAATQCQPGYYCPRGSAAATRCSPGKYCATAGLSKPTGSCSGGYYCTNTSSSATPTGGTTGDICPTGHFCPVNSSQPIECSAGTFNARTGSALPQDCVPCVAGKYCPSRAETNPTLSCTAGWYCPAGQRSPTPSEFLCPSGHFCPTGSPAPIKCVNGEYQDQDGQSTCKQCPAGWYCNAHTLCPMSNISMPVICPAGHYCTAGTRFAHEHPCPAGTYSNGTGLTAQAQCRNCPPGHHCPTPGVTEVGHLACFAGYLCLGSATVPNPPGDATGSICPQGSYCPAGTPAALKCPVGTYGSSSGLSDISQCTICPPGKYCPATGATNHAGNCQAGYYCTAGQTTSNPFLCPYGSYCPAGSGLPLRCPSGTMAIGVGKSACVSCEAGKYCDHTQPCTYCNKTAGGMPCLNNFTCPRSCPYGHYCPSGTRHAMQYPCPPGRFGDQLDLTDVSRCALCPTGQYCPYRGMTASSNLYCAAGFWCRNGSSIARPEDGVTGSRCPAGNYCPTGTVIPTQCPVGTFNPSLGAKNITGCRKCIAGTACTVPGLTGPDATCTAKFYCPGGMSSPTPPAFLCPRGFVCPAGSPAPRHCAAGTYTGSHGQDICQQCDLGYYCDHTDRCDLGNYSAPRRCPAGFYCPTGTANPFQFPCAAGTYSNLTGLFAQAQCQLCPPGKACTTPGLNDLTVPDCAPGYYCSGGAVQINPPGDSTGGPCTAGYYCPAGTAAPRPCPAGTFSNGTGLATAAECTNCTAGWYCPSTGLTAPQFPCNPGYYCPGGQSTGSPPEYPCAGGKVCPAGSATPRDCPDGSYVEASTTGKGTCDPCPGTFFCNLLEQQAAPYSQPGTHVIPVTCPAGYYCPSGTNRRHQYPCPTKTYSNRTGLVHISECTPCTPGHYCLNPGSLSETGLCEAGFFCSISSNMSQPAEPDVDPLQGGKCQEGKYCPFGSTEGIPCPTGTFFGGRGARNASACTRCNAGRYCQNTGNVDGNGQGPCSPGYYCPGGNDQPSDPTFVCPAGTYCGPGSVAPTPCQAGYFNNVPAQATCQICPPFKYCPIGTIVPKDCFQRHVCPSGTGYPLICPNGTYAVNSATLMDDFTKCIPCPAGRFCSNGTISGNCAAGFLCRLGNNRPDPDSATDGPLTSGLGSKIGGKCPIGHFCPEGSAVKLPCTNQTVGFTEGLERASDCRPCQPGYFCIETSVVPIPCPPGYYCPGNLGQSLGLRPCPMGTYNPDVRGTDISFCRPCKEGWYCPLEAMSSTYMFPTPPGFYSSSGQTEPYACPGGTYSAKGNGTAANASACLTCPVGHYCGPTASTFNVTCPEGTFCPDGSIYPFHCPGGYYCPLRARTPVPCPEGFHCPPLSVAPLQCWNGTYCPALTEIPLLCPNGYHSRNDTVLRVDVQESCTACPPGTWTSNTLFCEPCMAGHVCLGATTVGDPTDIELERGYICPEGHYCPTGSSEPVRCPAGTFNNRTGGRSITACLPCPRDFYNPNDGSLICYQCGKSSFANPGSAQCTCKGAHRVFQPDDHSCRCKPGYIFYTDGQRLSEEDSEFSCQPIIFPRCDPGQFRSATGRCVDPLSLQICDHCPGRSGVVDAQIGICACDVIQSEDEVCDQRCRSEANRVFIDGEDLVLYDPTTQQEMRIDIQASAARGKRTCGNNVSTCNVMMMQSTPSGTLGVYNPTEDLFLRAATGGQSVSSNTSSGVGSVRRQLLQTSGAATSGASGNRSDARTLVNPIVCVNNGESVMWDVSDPSRTHFPRYQKDNLLNTNPNFDYSAFRALEEKMRAPNLTTTMFIFAFTEPGIYVFQDNANEFVVTVIRVVSINERCPEARYQAVTQGSMVSMGVQREDNIILEPDWVLIGVLLAGLFLLVFGTIAGLWHFRRQTWGMVGSALPRYRNLGQELLSGKARDLASKGTHLGKTSLLATGEERLPAPPGSSQPITLQLETPLEKFDPQFFITTIAGEALVKPENVLILSITEGSTIVRFVITGCPNAQDAASLLINSIAEQASPIHEKLPILAFEALEDDMTLGQHPAFSMAALEDDFWDYERQIDLEGFNVRTLYDKLEDQTIHIVSQLANQRDDVLLLCDKILVESEALKDMFVKVKLDIDDRTKKERDMLEIRTQKQKDGIVEFDLPEDLKHTLTQFLEDFFKKNQFGGVGGVQYIAGPGGMEHTHTIRETHNVTAVIEGAPMTITRDHRSGAAAARPASAKARGADVDEVVGDATGDALKDVAGFCDMFGKAAKRGERAERIRRVDQSEFPREMRDDSDLDDDERAKRCHEREGFLAMKLRRARRAVDHAVTPTGLDELPAIPGVRDEKDIAVVAAERKAWQEARRAERVHADDIPAELHDDPRLSDEERAALSRKREVFLFNKLKKLRDGLEAIDVPPSLADDPSLPEDVRNARRAKAVKYMEGKVAKARRLRAETLLPAECLTDSDMSEGERAKRHEKADEKINEIMANTKAVPELPDPNARGISESDRRNREVARQKAVMARSEHAQSAVTEFDVPRGTSDRSDVDDKESKKREEARETYIKKNGRGAFGAKGKAKLDTLGGPGGIPKVDIKRQDFSKLRTEDPPLTTSRGTPKEYEDDSDLDDDERKFRGDCRKAFQEGKEAKFDAPLPMTDSGAGLPAAERQRRTMVNEAFKKGQRAANGADPEELKQAAEQVRKDAQTSAKDAEAKKYMEQGKKIAESAAAMPDEYQGKDESKKRLQAAFNNGKRAATVAAPPAELDEPAAAAVFERAAAAVQSVDVPPDVAGRKPLETAFKMGRHAQGAKAVEDLIELEEATEGRERVAHDLRAALERGRRAVALVATPAELAEDKGLRAAFAMGVDGDDPSSTMKSNAKQMAAFMKGRDARSQVDALVDDYRDDVPLLSEEAVADRRRQQGAFKDGFKAALGMQRIQELPEGSTEQKEAKAAFEAGAKAQKAAEVMPAELVGAEGARAAKDRAAFIRGRAARHMADALVDDLPEGVDTAARHALQEAQNRGKKSQQVLDAVPAELEDAPGLDGKERDRRERLRRALRAGKLMKAAANLGATMAQVKKSAEPAAPTEAKEGVSSPELEKELHKLKKEHVMAFRQLKEKQKLDVSNALEELEETNIRAAKELDDRLGDHFMLERKKLTEKHALELLSPGANPTELKVRQEREVAELQESQALARKEAQDNIIRVSKERKEKLKAILEAKGLNELRLQKTIQVNQEEEIKRLHAEAAAAAAKMDLTTEEEHRKQKEQLLEKLKAREKRLKAKASKEKEFLETELKQKTALEVESIDMSLQAKHEMLKKRAKDMHARGLISDAQLAKELDEMDKDLTREREQKQLSAEAARKSDRMAAEKLLHERHAAEKTTELERAQKDVDSLLSKQAEEAAGGEAKEEKAVAKAVEDTVKILMNAAEQRKLLKEKLEKERLAEAAKQQSLEDQKAKADAKAEIDRREKEGQRLTEQQKLEIYEEAKNAARRMDVATSEEAKKQADANKRMLEEHRRKRERELQKKQLAAMQKELERQQQQEKEKETKLAAKIVKPVELPPEVETEKAELEERTKRALEDMRRKHEQEARQMEQQLAAELEKEEKAKLAKIKQTHQQQMLDLMAKQSAKESAPMNETQRKELLRQHERESSLLQAKLDAESKEQHDAVQARVQAQLARKKAALERKQREEMEAQAAAQRAAQDEIVKEAQISAEKKAIDETLRRSSVRPEDAQDVASVIMADRHRKELGQLAERQKARRDAERVRFVELRERRRDELHVQMENEAERRAAADPDNEVAIRRAMHEEEDKQAKLLDEELRTEEATYFDQLELEHTEEQLQLKLQQWNEVSEACGMASPDQVMAKVRAQAARRGVDSAEKELLEFKKVKAMEQQAMEEKLAKEKKDYEDNLKKELLRRKQEQDAEYKRMEAEMVKKIEEDRKALQARLKETQAAARQAGGGGMSGEEQKALANKMLQESKEDEERLKQRMRSEKEKQDQELADVMRRKKERLERRRAATDSSTTSTAIPASPLAAEAAPAKVSLTGNTGGVSADLIGQVLSGVTTGGVESTSAQRTTTSTGSAFTTGPAPAAVPSGAHDQWVAAVVGQLQRSPLMEKVIHIESMLEQQQKSSVGLLSYYLDVRDRQQGKNEGRLEPVDAAELPTSQYVSFFFANAVKDNIAKSGVALPSVRVQVAKSLPAATSQANAFRNSYHYDHAKRTLYIRDSRLNTLGEACVVLLHGLAHIKATTAAARDDFSGWNDSDPAFLKEFYGLLECSAEEMFFLRLPAMKATRDAKPGRDFRPDSIMSQQSLKDLEGQLKRISKNEREAHLRQYFMMSE